jgi:hypothetical protein
VALGTHSTFSSFNFNDDSLYLAIKVGADAEMTPRIRFTSVPYAFVAKTVVDDALDFAQFQDILDVDANLTVNQTGFTWTQTYTGTSAPGLSYTASGAVSSGNAAALDVNVSNASTTVPAMMLTNAGSGFALRINDDGTTTDSTPLVVDANGNVGIGTTSPSQKLDIVGYTKTNDLIVNNNHAWAAQANADPSVQGSLRFITTHTGAGNEYTYHRITPSTYGYAIVAGDQLEFDIYCSTANPSSVCDAGIEIDNSDASNGRTLGITDQNSITVHSGNKASYALGRWYHVKASLANLVGKTINYVSVVEESDTDGSYTNYYRKIFITNGSTTKNVIWDAGVPQANTIGYGSGNSANDVSGSYYDEIYATGTGNNYFAGNVGIGTTAPVGRLDVTDTSNTAASLSLTNNTATTIGNAGNTLGVLDLQSTSLTTGNFLNMEVNALTTGTALNISRSGAGLTTGGELVNLDMGAAVAGNGLNIATTGVYTGTGLITLTANAATTGVVSSISNTGLTTGTGLLITGGTTLQAAGELLDLNMGAATTGSAATLRTTGVFTNTAGLLNITANAATTGSLAALSGTGLTTGTGLSITTNTALQAAGELLDLNMGAATTGSAATLRTTGIYTNTAGLLNITANGATTGSLAALSGTGLTSGTGLSITGGTALAANGELLYLNMGAATAGNGASIITTGAYTGTGLLTLTANSATTGDIMNVSATGLTTGSALIMTGPSAAGVTDHFLKITSDVGSASSLIYGAPDFSGSTVTGYGLNITATDSTATANTDYANYSLLTLTGNAAKTGYGTYGRVTTASTTADTTYGGNFSTATTGAVTTGTQNTYGLYSTATSANVAGGTVNAYGGYFRSGGTVASGTINSYGLYIANGTMNTTGTANNFGLYVEAPTGADTNVAGYFGGNVGIGTTAPISLFSVGTGSPFQVDTNGDIIKLKNLTYAWPASHTTNGFLQNNGSGTLTWTTITGAGGVTGSGTDNYIPRWNGTTALENSIIFDDGTNVGIGTTMPTAKLQITDSNGTESTILRLRNKAWSANQVTSILFSHGGEGAVDVLDNGGAIKSKLYAGGDDTELQFWTTQSSTMSQRMTILNNGNVGIGTTSPTAKLQVGKDGTAVVSDGFEDGTLTPFTTSGDASWAVQGTTVYAGSYAAQAGTIAGNQSTTMSLASTLTNPSRISFYFKVSSESGFDIMTFLIDGIPQKSWSGEVGWVKYSTYVNAGSRTFSWKYSKDSGSNVGSDTAWVDDVTITENNDQAKFVSSVEIGDVTSGSNAILSVGGNINTNGFYQINGNSILNTLGSGVCFGIDSCNGSNLEAFNTFLGAHAGKNNTLGWANTLVGNNAGLANTTGVRNTFVGENAGYSNTIGGANIAIGQSALYANTEGNYNVAMGANALDANDVGLENTAIGWHAVGQNTSGGRNTGVGAAALYLNTTGSYNVAVGRNAGRYYGSGTDALTDPENSIYIGYNSRAFSNDDSNSIVIGYEALGLGANTVVLGNDSITTTALKGNVGIGTTSPTAKLTVQGTNSIASLGSELLTTTADRDFSGAGNWTGTGWTVGSGVATHTAGANEFVHTFTPTANSIYQIKATINTTTAGTIGAKIGSTAGSLVGHTVATLTQHTWVIEATDTGSLRFSPDATWAGTIDDVTVMEITPTSEVLHLSNSDGSAGLRFRSGGTDLHNFFVGEESGVSNISGLWNIGIGRATLKSNLSANGNIALGDYALTDTTTGAHNVALGDNVLNNNTIGKDNVAIGRSAMAGNITGENNTAIGGVAMATTQSGSNNTAIGYASMWSNSTGGYNAGLGRGALYSNTTGSYNTALGYRSSNKNTTGSYITALGTDAGMYFADGVTSLTDAENSIYIGALARGYNNDDSNSIVIGYGAIGIGANTIVLGNDSITTTALKGNVGIGTTAPGQKLDVAGDAEIANYLYFGNSTSEYLRWDTSNFLLSDDFLPNANDALDLGSDTARWRDLYLGGETLHIGATTTDEGTISYTSSNVLSFTTDSTTNGDIAFFTDDLYLDKSSSKVGIGTTSPATALEIRGDTRTLGSSDISDVISLRNNSNTELFRVRGYGDAFLQSTLYFGSIGSSNRIGAGSMLLTSNQSTGNTFAKFIHNNGSTALDLLSNSHVILQATAGNVGIGTTAPVGRLDVTDTSNTAASLSLTNNTATTIGNAGNTLGVLDLQSTSLTTGNFLNMEVNALTTGTALNISRSGAGLTTGGELVNLDMGAAVAGNGLNIATTGVYTGTGLITLTANAATTGTLAAIAGNGLTTGTGLSIASTSTALTTGKLMSLDWSPSGSTEIYATGDLFRINTGTYANVGNLLNVLDDGSSLFSVSQSQITNNLPTAFNAAGDVSMAYDLIFTNQTTANIFSNGPLSIVAGESWENNNLTLQTYGTGDLIANLSGTGRLLVPTGNVGIGTTAPGYTLDVKSSGTNVARFIGSNSTGCTLSDGGIIACSSDRNLKKNIVESELGLDAIMNLRTVTFNWNFQVDGDKKYLGFIAQEVEEVAPDLVTTDSTGYKQLNSIGIIPIVAKAIQEQQGLISTLQSEAHLPDAKIATVSAKLENLNTKVSGWDGLFISIQSIIQSIQETFVAIQNQLGFVRSDIQSTKEQVASLSASLTDIANWKEAVSSGGATLGQSSGSAVLGATDSAMLGEVATASSLMVKNNLQVDGKTTLFDLTVLNKLTSGVIQIGAGIDGDEINASTGIRFQTLAQGPVDFMNGKVIIDVDGSISAKHFKLDTLDATSSTGGKAIMPAGEILTTVQTTSVNANSMVYITIQGDYAPATRYWVTNQVEGDSFMVQFDRPTTLPVEFSWFIIN